MRSRCSWTSMHAVLVTSQVYSRTTDRSGTTWLHAFRPLQCCILASLGVDGSIADDESGQLVLNRLADLVHGSLIPICASSWLYAAIELICIQSASRKGAQREHYFGTIDALFYGIVSGSSMQQHYPQSPFTLRALSWEYYLPESICVCVCVTLDKLTGPCITEAHVNEQYKSRRKGGLQGHES